MKRYLTLLLSAVLILSLFTACGSSGSSSDYNSAAPEEMMDSASNELSASAQPGQGKLPENRKWVITSEVQTETHDMDATITAVLDKTNELQGYVENQNFDNGSYGSGRHVRLTIRVPAEDIDAFMKTVEEATNVIYSSRNLEDITLQYSDTEVRIAALKAEEARLLEFMEQAETMSELLEIESRLTNVHYELENVSSRLRTYDNQVNYATIHLTIQEVVEYTPTEEPGFLERISTGFVDSLHGVADGVVDFTVFLIVASPYLVVWALFILLILAIVRLCRNQSKKRKARKAAGQAPEAAPVQDIPEEWKKFDKTSEKPEEEQK